MACEDISFNPAGDEEPLWDMQQRQRREQAVHLEQQLDRQRKKLLSDEARRAKAAADTVGAVKEGPDGVRMGPVTRERERNRSCSPAYPF